MVRPAESVHPLAERRSALRVGRNFVPQESVTLGDLSPGIRSEARRLPGIRRPAKAPRRAMPAHRRSAHT